MSWLSTMCEPSHARWKNLWPMRSESSNMGQKMNCVHINYFLIGVQLTYSTQDLLLKNFVTTSPVKSAYGFTTLNCRRPGHFNLCFLTNKNSTMQTWVWTIYALNCICSRCYSLSMSLQSHIACLMQLLLVLHQSYAMLSKSGALLQVTCLSTSWQYCLDTFTSHKTLLGQVQGQKHLMVLDLIHQATCLFRIRSMGKHQTYMAAKPLHHHPRLEVMYWALITVYSHCLGINPLHNIHPCRNQWNNNTHPFLQVWFHSMSPSSRAQVGGVGLGGKAGLHVTCFLLYPWSYISDNVPPRSCQWGLNPPNLLISD